MTGFGRYHLKNAFREILVEARSVNNRYLKVNVSLDDCFSAFEEQALSAVKDRVSRGTVDVRVRLRRAGETARGAFNETLIASAAESWRGLARRMGLDQSIDARALFLVPGAFEAAEDLGGAAQEEWKLVAAGIDEALAGLVSMRETEGAAMAREVRNRAGGIARIVAEIRRLAPVVVEEYARKLARNVSAMLAAGGGAPISQDDLRREIAVFADRCDINEECVRTEKHLEELGKVVESGGETGRKMEFIGQELLREINTMSSKANNFEISRLAVEAKTEVEKIKEIAQNIE